MIAPLSRSATKNLTDHRITLKFASLQDPNSAISWNLVWCDSGEWRYRIFHFLLFCYLYSQGFIHPSLPLISFKLRCVSRDWLLSLNRDCVFPQWGDIRQVIHLEQYHHVCDGGYSERLSGQACNISNIIIYMMVVDTLKDYSGNLVVVSRQKGNVLLVIYSRRKSKLI